MNEARTILVADDDDDDVLLLRRAFAKAGILDTLVAVRNGDEAIAYLFRSREISLACLAAVGLEDARVGWLRRFGLVAEASARRTFAHRRFQFLEPRLGHPESYGIGRGCLLLKTRRFRLFAEGGP